MSLLDLLAGGGPLPLPKIPCAICIAYATDPKMAVEPSVTLAGGSLVCRAHVRLALEPDELATQINDVIYRENTARQIAKIRARHEAGEHDGRWIGGCPLCHRPGETDGLSLDGPDFAAACAVAGCAAPPLPGAPFCADHADDGEGPF